MTDLPRFRPLPEIPVPPMLEEAVAYGGEGRWVAVYLSDEGRKLVHTDGGQWITSTEPEEWLAFLQHPRVAPHLGDCDVYGCKGPACALLLDRNERQLFAGTVTDVTHFLAEQPSPLTAEYDHLQQMLEDPDKLHAYLSEAMQRHEQRQSSESLSMVEWLDSLPDA